MGELKHFFSCFLILFCIPVLFSLGQEEEQGDPAGYPFLNESSLPETHPRYLALQVRRTERFNMVSDQIYKRGITDETVLNAMMNTPRHIFVIKDYQLDAYQDTPLPIDYGQTISQPYVVGFMTMHLDLQPGDKVLEIGTGSGYQAAVLSELTDHVFTIEIIKELYLRTKELYEKYQYNTIKMKHGDGYYGWEEEAPFDAIIVTAAAGHVPPPLVAQLKPGGKIIIPVGGIYAVQSLLLVIKDAEGNLSTEQLLPVRFVPMTGSILND